MSRALRIVSLVAGGLLMLYGVLCLIGNRNSFENIQGVGIAFIVLGGVVLLTGLGALSVRFLGKVRWAVLIWYHAAYTPVVVLLLIAFITRAEWMEDGMDKYLFSPFFELFVWPAVVANVINAFALMIEGQRKANWVWWRQLAALWLVSLPVFGVFYYAGCRRQFDLIAGSRENSPPERCTEA